MEERIESLSFLDRHLTLLIAAAMLAGVAVGHFLPDLSGRIASTQIGGTPILIAAGLILMMYPPLARVRYDRLVSLGADARSLALSLVLNWIIGPFLMFGLAVAFLSDYPELMTGLILVGIARCIAMVLVWNQLAKGSTEFAAGLVALNSLFQVLTFAFYAWFFTSTLPQLLGLNVSAVDVSMSAIASNVALFLGLPFAAGAATSVALRRSRGDQWYTAVFMRRLSPLALVALLFTIFVMFSLQGEAIIGSPSDALRVAVPLTLYFAIMFALSLLLAWRMGAGYEKSVSVAFTAAGNNFELAIAVAIGLYGVLSPVAFATAIGPLIEVPVLIALVRLTLAWRRRLEGRGISTSSDAQVPV